MGRLRKWVPPLTLSLSGSRQTIQVSMNSLQLERGILLEDIAILLPWGASPRSLRRLGKQQVGRLTDRVRLFWTGHILLGGLKCQVEATFWKNQPASSKISNMNDCLELVFLNFPASISINPRVQHTDLKAQLTRVLGWPTFDGNGEYPDSDLPSTEWNLEAALIVLNVVERFGEYCVGEIWHKPLPTWRVARTNQKGA